MTRSSATTTLLDVARRNRLAARAAGLVYVDVSSPGIRRVGCGRGFRYVSADGKPVREAAQLDRIRALAIPPAWREVWICPNPRGHVQVTGKDARGRKQYRYHADWRATRDADKFDRMIAFGEALPRIRRRVRRDLVRPGLPRERVLAVIVALLDSTLARIGNLGYARDNKTFGLSTLRDRHVQFLRDGRATIRFKGKGGIEREITIGDKRLARIVRRCRDVPGQHLFQFLGDDGARHPVDSGMVNDYLHEIAGCGEGPGFTAKDFRTWGATLRAIALMGCTPLPEVISERALASCIAKAVREVADHLGNTPAVCRKSYINPVVFEAWRDGSLHHVVREDLSRAPRRAEKLALAFLRRQAEGDIAGDARLQKAA